MSQAEDDKIYQELEAIYGPLPRAQRVLDLYQTQKDTQTLINFAQDFSLSAINNNLQKYLSIIDITKTVLLFLGSGTLISHRRDLEETLDTVYARLRKARIVVEQQLRLNLSITNEGYEKGIRDAFQHGETIENAIDQMIARYNENKEFIQSELFLAMTKGRLSQKSIEASQENISNKIEEAEKLLQNAEAASNKAAQQLKESTAILKIRVRTY